MIWHWKKWHDLNDAILESIDWDTLAMAYKEVSSTKRRWASKWISGHFSQGKNMTYWYFWSSAACPCCGYDPEDKIHVICCPYPEAEKTWDASLKQLQVWLCSQQTYWPIMDAIIQGIATWQHPLNSGASSDFAAEGWCNQHNIGWDSLLDGWVAWSWGNQQSLIWLTRWSQKLSWCWTIKLIKKLWNVAWDMWEHCNSILHNALQALQKSIESCVNNDIQARYVASPRSLPRDAMHLVDKPIKHQLALPMTIKQQWLESVALTIDRKVQHDFGN